MRYTTDGTLLLDSGVPIANADYEQTAQRLADALNAAGSASRDAEVARLRGALERIAQWMMHSGADAYARGHNEPRGYYAEAFTLMEREITEARAIARAALNQEPHHAAE